MNRALFTVISSIPLLLLAAPGAARAADLQAELKGLADNERAFAKMASEPDKTVRDAFLAFVADDGVIFGEEGPTNAKAAFSAAPAPPPGTPKLHLLWWPTHAEIASSGDLGWTTGPSKRMRGDQVGYGHFVTVWKKQADGKWRFLIDHGIQTDEMSTLGPDTPIPPLPAEKTAKDAKDKTTVKPVDAKAALDQLMTADRELSKITAAGDKAGWLNWMADDGRLLRNGPQPAVGKDAVRAALEKEAPLTSKPLGGGVSAAGDLGYTYGKGTWKKADSTQSGDYLRIWEKRGGTWKVAMDEFVADPPPPPTPPATPAPPKKDGR
jgi:ketosteroid isomerase-like protein